MPRKRPDITPVHDIRKHMVPHEDEKRTAFPNKSKLERFWPIIVALFIMILILVYYH